MDYANFKVYFSGFFEGNILICNQLTSRSFFNETASPGKARPHNAAKALAPTQKGDICNRCCNNDPMACTVVLTLIEGGRPPALMLAIVH
jgi:hypothetical protein